jgi:hypothetical protein
MLLKGPCWSTAALGGGGAGQPLELVALHEHLQGCRHAAGRGFALRCGAEAVQAFVLARFVSSALALLALLAGAAWLLR